MCEPSHILIKAHKCLHKEGGCSQGFRHQKPMGRTQGAEEGLQSENMYKVRRSSSAAICFILRTTEFPLALKMRGKNVSTTNRIQIPHFAQKETEDQGG